MEITWDSSAMFTCTALRLQWHEDRWSARRLTGQDGQDPWASASGDRKSCDLRQILPPFSSSFFLL